MSADVATQTMRKQWLEGLAHLLWSPAKLLAREVSAHAALVARLVRRSGEFAPADVKRKQQEIARRRLPDLIASDELMLDEESRFGANEAARREENRRREFFTMTGLQADRRLRNALIPIVLQPDCPIDISSLGEIGNFLGLKEEREVRIDVPKSASEIAYLEARRGAIITGAGLLGTFAIIAATRFFILSESPVRDVSIGIGAASVFLLIAIALALFFLTPLRDVLTARKFEGYLPVYYRKPNPEQEAATGQQPGEEMPVPPAPETKALSGGTLGGLGVESGVHPATALIRDAPEGISRPEPITSQPVIARDDDSRVPRYAPFPRFFDPEFGVNSADGELQLVVEVKPQSDPALEWASHMYASLLEEAGGPVAPYYLLVTADRFYLWVDVAPDRLSVARPPDYTGDTYAALLAACGNDDMPPDKPRAGGADAAVAYWLSRLTHRDDIGELAESERGWFVESGLHNAVRDGDVVMDPVGTLT